MLNKIFFILLVLVSSHTQLFAQTNSLTITWDPNTEADINTYQVYRSTSPAARNLIETVQHPINVYSDNSIEKGVQYYYRLRATNLSQNQSDFSAEVSAAIPEITIPDLIISNSEGLNDLFTLDNSSINDPDHGFNDIVWTVEVEAPYSVTINESNIVQIDQGLSFNQTVTMTFTATDPDSFFDIKNVVYSVQQEVNQAPIIDETELDTAYVGLNYSFQLSASDLENDPLTFIKRNGSPEWMNVSSSGLITGIPDSVGTFAVRLRVSDGNLFDNWNTSIAVIELNSLVQKETEVIAYPVPFRAGMGVSHITFDDLPGQGKLFIYDLLGNPVYKKEINGPTDIWNVENMVGKQVRSGVYMFVVKSDKGKKISSGKVIIVR